MLMLGDARLTGESRAPRPPGAQPPPVSVVIPTFNRPRLLARAIESVQAQTRPDWELIISDDQPHPGPGREVAAAYAAGDPRIRVVANPGPRGQCGNLNHAMSKARAAWIKPLFDDDLLRPDCLRLMLDAAARCPDAVLIRCLADHYAFGRARRLHRRGRLPPVQRLPGPSARAAMLLQDVEIGMPTQVLVNAAAVRAGATMEDPDGLLVGVDWWWFARLLRLGDLVLVNLALVEEHQGEHATVTSTARHDLLYDEMRRLRRDLAPLVPATLRHADPRASEGIVSLVQAAREAAGGHLTRGLARAAGVRSLAAWKLTARLALRRLFPGRFERFPRERLDLPAAPPGPAPADMLNPACPPALSASRS